METVRNGNPIERAGGGGSLARSRLGKSLLSWTGERK